MWGRGVGEKGRREEGTERSREGGKKAGEKEWGVKNREGEVGREGCVGRKGGVEERVKEEIGKKGEKKEEGGMGNQCE